MKKLIAYLILFSFVLPVPVRAGLDTGVDQVEQPLIEKQKQIEKQRLQEYMLKDMQKKQAEDAEKRRLEEEMAREFQKKQAMEAAQSEAKNTESSGSSWWKWTLGLLVVGGIAAAAGGGGGGGTSGGGNSGGSTDTGGATATW